MQIGLLVIAVMLQFSTVQAKIPQREKRKRESPVPCYLDLCFCQGTVANCSGANLTYIPRVWSNITIVIMTDNLLYDITKTSLKNLTYIKLTNLTLASNRIVHISANAFTVLKRLKMLSLDTNRYLNLPNLMRAFKGLSYCRSLQELRLQGLGLQHLPKNIFQSLRYIQLRCLKLDHNNLTVYDQSVFSPLKHLESIFLGYNEIQTANWGFAPSLKYIYLYKNLISDIDFFCPSETCFYPNLRELRFDNNNIAEIPQFTTSCLPNAEILGFNENPIRKILSNTFSSLRRLQHIFLQDLFGAGMFIQGFAFNNSQLNHISLKGSSVEFRTNVHKDVFRGCYALAKLDLSYDYLGGLSEKSFCSLFQDIKNLTYLHIGSSKLKNISIILNCGLKRLAQLDISGNSIAELPTSLFTSFPNLTHLIADHNAITTLDEDTFPLEARENLQVIRLYENPFACTCDIRWFIQWADQEKKKFGSYPDNYLCKTPTIYMNTKLSNLNLTNQECLLKEAVAVIVVAVAFALLTLVTVFSLIYRWRWQLRYIIYLLKYQGHRNNPVGREYRYDCFVVYSPEETNWIIQNLIPNLEDSAGLTLCIDERDFDVGGAIVDNIVENIDISRKILIVLSNKTLQSEWCQFEINFSLRRSLNSELGFLVVILKDEIESRNMSNTVRSLLDLNTYITWPQDENDIEARALFWERVTTTIRNNGRA